MTERPKVTVITPSLNASAVIADCLSSVACQSVRAEHLVVDGFSTDGTPEMVNANSPCATLMQSKPEGIYAAINNGIRIASGDIVGILHADDFYPEADALEQVAAEFADPEIAACYGDLCYVDRTKPKRIVRYWQAGELQPVSFFNGWMPPHPALFVRRKVYEQFGLYRTDLGTAADYEMMLRLLLKHGLRTVYLPRILVHMRSGGASNASLRARLTANRMDRRAWQVNGLRPRPWTMLAKPLRKVSQFWARP